MSHLLFVLNESLARGLVQLARTAGKATLPYFQDPALTSSLKSDTSPVTAADLASHRILTDGLPRLTPAIPIVSEEGDDGAAALQTIQSSPSYWLIDPLDGTREFIAGNAEFCVCIALVEGGRPTLGLIHAPALRWTFLAIQGQGCIYQHDDDRQAWQPARTRSSSRKHPTFLISRNHARGEEEMLRRAYPDSVIQATGSAWKYCLIARGEADVAARRSPTSLWDIAAAACILNEAGGAVKNWDGAELRYTGPQLQVAPFIAAGDPSCQWPDALRSVLAMDP